MEFTANDFNRETDVSRETLERLEAYIALLAKWQKAINLIGSQTLKDVWHRHVLDSAQLRNLAPPASKNWIDLGSGAGFPGMVLSILGVGDVFLLEKDARKCVFLREANRITGSGARIIEGQVEEIVSLDPESRPFPAPQVITARAVAPLDRLLTMARPLCIPDTVCLFPKGQDVERELTVVTKYPNIQVDKLPSCTDPCAVILCIKGLANGT